MVTYSSGQRRPMGARAPWNSADSSVWGDEPTNWFSWGGLRPVTLLDDPTGLYPRGGRFTVGDLVCTAARGYWPEGTRFKLCYQRRNEERDLVVRGGALVDVATGEWMLPKSYGSYRWIKPGEETLQLLVDCII